MKVTTHKTISQSILSKNKDTLFIIEDNDKETSYNSICLDSKFDNLICLKTKKGNTKKRGDLYNDKTFTINKQKILINFLDIKEKLLRYKKISLKETGYGNYLKSYAPKTYDYLCDMIQHNLYFNNSENVYQKRTPSYKEIINSKVVDISDYNTIKTELIKNFKSIALTTKEEFKSGEIIRVKHSKTLDEIICKVNIPSYEIKNISLDRYNLFEGYTKSNVGDLQFHIDYVGSIKSGVITYADDYLNKINNNESSDKKVDTFIKEPVNTKSIEYNSSNWFGDDIKSNLDNFIKTQSKDENYSVLDLKNNNYLVISDGYLYEINHFDKNFKIINKLKVIDYKLVDLFGSINLFIKENIYNQDRITQLKIENIDIKLIQEFIKSKI